MSNDSSPIKYVKVWGILLVLLVISIVGPELGIRAVTLVTAFGVAIVKALIVAKEFMHLDAEKKYIHYMFYTTLLFMLIFFAGTVVDVMKNEGQHWENEAAQELIDANKDWHDRVH